MPQGTHGVLPTTDSGVMDTDFATSMIVLQAGAKLLDQTHKQTHNRNCPNGVSSREELSPTIGQEIQDNRKFHATSLLVARELKNGNTHRQGDL